MHVSRQPAVSCSFYSLWFLTKEIVGDPDQSAFVSACSLTWSIRDITFLKHRARQLYNILYVHNECAYYHLFMNCLGKVKHESLNRLSSKYWIWLQIFNMNKTLLWCVTKSVHQGFESDTDHRRLLLLRREGTERLTKSSPGWKEILQEVNRGETFKRNTHWGFSTKCAQSVSVLHGLLFMGC